MRKHHFSFAAAIAALILTWAPATKAEDAVEGVLEACQTELASYCKDVTPGNGRVLACMYAHEDKISDACAGAVVDLADAIDFMFASARQAMDICAPDIEGLCAGTEMGGGRILSCLKENEDQVSAECKTEATAFAEKFGLAD